jgi:hypothetical protein
MPDPRKRPEKATFPVEFVVMMALLMFCGQCGSRRQLDRDRKGAEFGLNLWKMVGGKHMEACCSDTMNNVMAGLAPEEFDRLIALVAAALHRNKALRNFLCNGKLVVAVDGTQMYTFGKRHCDGCQTRTLADGSTQYFHYVLAAKIVTSIGLVVPFAFEFCENPADMGEFDKQDCELKASRRLFTKIRTLFPKQEIMLVGDGLYADETTFSLCEKYGWDLMVTRKEGKIPTLDSQLEGDATLWGGKRVVGHTLPAPAGKKGVRLERRLYWKTPMKYRELILHAVRSEEYDADGTRLYMNEWITNVKPEYSNALELAQSGRLRWKIENEGTNTQKNGGYGMEHGYGLGGNAWKNYYLVMQLGQLFNDLVRLGDLLQKLAGDKRANFARLYGSMANFARRLMESLRNTALGATPPWGNGDIQIRLAGTG